MKQLFRFVYLLMLLCVASGAALAQAPPRELEGNYAPTDQEIELRWHVPNTMTLPSFYNVYRRGPFDSSFSVIATPADRRYDDSNIVLNSAYAYKVTAVYAGNVESTPTNTVLVGTFDSSGGPMLPPRNLIGSFDDRGVNELDWTAPDTPASPSFYKVYRKENPMSGFMPIAIAPEPEFDDSLIMLNHTYAYKVTAMYVGQGESDPSNIVEIHTHSDSTEDSGFVALRFTTEPVRMAFVGQPYSYDAEAVSTPPGAPICYTLPFGPPGMTIDNSTGLVNWTPASMGVFKVEIKARTCTGPEGEAEQEYYVIVLSGNPGSIGGTVTNNASEGLRGMKMKLFNVSMGFFVLRTFTDSLGHYSFPFVNPGTYLLRTDAEHDTYEDEWFDNARRREDATPIVVTEGNTFTANFILERHDTFALPTYTLSGTVMDTLNAPIAGVRVSVFHKCSDDSSDDSDDDHSDDSHEHHGFMRTVETDANGFYSFTLRAGRYIVGAKKNGYLPQYYDHKRQPFEADVVNLTAPVTGIDFHLIPRVLGSGSISGVIRSALDSTGIRSFVLGFRKRDHNTSFRGFVSSTYTDSTGYYTLDNLADGNYIILAVPSGRYTPTFYNTSGGTPFLRDASPVAVTGSAVTGIDIYARSDSDDGLNTVAGHVSSDDGGGMMLNAVSPLSGVLVTITDPATDMPLSASISETDGMFSAAGLAPGQYTVVFQKPEYDVVSLPVTVSYTNNAPTVVLANAQMTVEGGPGAPGLMGVHQSWNIVSLPVDVVNGAKTVVFPSAVSDAFDFSTSGGFQPRTTLSPGTGYWLKFPNASIFTVDGTVRTSQTISVSEGWNLVGGISSPVNISGITSNPAGLVASPFWEYHRSYAPSAVVEAGRGYWVKASGAGTLTMNASATAPKGTPMFSEQLSRMNRVTITDAAGNSQSLYFGASSGDLDIARLEMPPLPPAGAFDVRFASSRMAETYDADQKISSDYGIEIRGAAMPITVAWNISEPSAHTSLRGADGNAIAQMKSSTGTLQLGSAAGLVLRIESASLPKVYGLEQNYPNPFNPTTSIRFQLPVLSKVSVKVYNIIGQEVAVLVNGEVLEAGEQSVRFDASNFTSGVYFYRLSAEATAKEGKSESFVSVKKMMLVK